MPGKTKVVSMTVKRGVRMTTGKGWIGRPRQTSLQSESSLREWSLAARV
jgi:hypothetical protein